MSCYCENLSFLHLVCPYLLWLLSPWIFPLRSMHRLLFIYICHQVQIWFFMRVLWSFSLGTGTDRLFCWPLRDVSSLLGRSSVLMLLFVNELCTPPVFVMMRFPSLVFVSLRDITGSLHLWVFSFLLYRDAHRKQPLYVKFKKISDLYSFSFRETYSHINIITVTYLVPFQKKYHKKFEK